MSDRALFYLARHCPSLHTLNLRDIKPDASRRNRSGAASTLAPAQQSSATSEVPLTHAVDASLDIAGSDDFSSRSAFPDFHESRHSSWSAAQVAHAVTGPGRRITAADTEELAQSFSNSSIDESGSFIMFFVRYCKYLRVMRLGQSAFGCEAFAALRHCPKLTELQATSSHCNELTQATVMRTLSEKRPFTNLHALSLEQIRMADNQLLLAICESCPELKALSLSLHANTAQDRFTTAGLDALATTLGRSLRQLRLDRCKHVTDDGLATLLESLWVCEVLSLRFFDGLTRVSLARIARTCGTTLRDLRLVGCLRLYQSAYQEEFDVLGSAARQCAFDPIAFPHLETLDVSVTTVSDEYLSSLHCPSLCTIKLLGCPVKGPGVTHLLRASPRLGMLRLTSSRVGDVVLAEVGQVAQSWYALVFFVYCNTFSFFF